MKDLSLTLITLGVLALATFILYLAAARDWQEDTLNIVSGAMDALESDATDEARCAAWEALRDHFYPEAALQAGAPPPPDPRRRCS